jgi:two-component system, NarL family, response regulator LiaR
MDEAMNGIANQKPVRVFIADDHAMVRNAISTWIQTIPELSLVGEATNGEDAITGVLALKPDVVLMDLMMPKVDGIAATRAILAAFPQARILMVTSFTEKKRAVESVQAGVRGFILKDASLDDLLDAILSIAKGRTWFSMDLARSMAETNEPLAGLDGEVEALTGRELEVLKLLACGNSDDEIAEKLVIGRSTVRFHIHQILAKLKVPNRTQAALIAIRKGLAAP